MIATLGGVEPNNFPSNFIIPKWGLLGTLYVDDMLVRGPQENHVRFGRKLGNIWSLKNRNRSTECWEGITSQMKRHLGLRTPMFS